MFQLFTRLLESAVARYDECSDDGGHRASEGGTQVTKRSQSRPLTVTGGGRLASVLAAVVVPLLVVALVLVGCGRKPVPREFKGTVLVDPQLAPDFTATDQHGREFRLSEQRGKVVALYFGYTYCPDACPTTMLDFRRVREALGSDAENVQFAMLTVDPERDTAEVLGEYLRVRGHESFLGLTGTVEELAPIWQAYGVFVQKAEAPRPGIDYWMNHTAATYVIDMEGKLRLMEPWDAGHELLLNDIQILLEEGRAR